MERRGHIARFIFLFSEKLRAAGGEEAVETGGTLPLSFPLRCTAFTCQGVTGGAAICSGVLRCHPRISDRITQFHRL